MSKFRFEEIPKWNPYRKYEVLREDLKRYNRADTVNMSEEEMNEFRHIAGGAKFTQEYNPGVARLFGWGKEIKDRILGRSQEDTEHDFVNNELGIMIGKENKNLDSNALYDLIVKDYVRFYKNFK